MTLGETQKVRPPLKKMPRSHTRLIPRLTEPPSTDCLLPAPVPRDEGLVLSEGPERDLMMILGLDVSDLSFVGKFRNLVES